MKNNKIFKILKRIILRQSHKNILQNLVIFNGLVWHLNIFKYLLSNEPLSVDIVHFGTDYVYIVPFDTVTFGYSTFWKWNLWNILVRGDCQSCWRPIIFIVQSLLAHFSSTEHPQYYGIQNKNVGTHVVPIHVSGKLIPLVFVLH